MRSEEVKELQGIAERLLLLCARAKIENSESEAKVLQFRKNIKVVFNDETGQSSAGWTAKEIKDMPGLKDLHYRFTAGVHQYRYRKNGYNVQFSSKNKEVAKEKAYEFIKSIKKALSVSNCGAVSRGTKLDTVAEAWLELKKNHSAKETFQSYKSVYKNHIKPVLGERNVKNILPMDLQPFFNELFSRYERKAEDAKIILNGVFKYAVANRLCASNPMEAVIVEKHFRKKGVALDEEQLTRFKETMNRSGAVGLAGLIVLYSGVRSSELPTIRFDWSAGTMTISNSKLKKSQKRNPLNLVRTIPIFPNLYSLRSRIEASDEWRKKVPFSKFFIKIWSEHTPKDLRHTFISKAREFGVENELVSIWTGHSAGTNVTANTYTHFSMEYQKREALKIKEY